jgi:hypothetical protein
VTKVLAYVYGAQYVCPKCARDDWHARRLQVPPHDSMVASDEHGLPQRLVDRNEQEEVGVLFSTDAGAHPDGECCGYCGREVVAAQLHTWHFDRFKVTLLPSAVRECSAVGDCTQACEAWLDRCGMDWSKVPVDLLAEELLEQGAWTEEDLKDEDGEWDEHQCRIRVLWIAANNIEEDKR